MVLGHGSNWDRQLLAEKTLSKKSSVTLAVLGIFWGHGPTGRESLSDYSVVNFSMFSFKIELFFLPDKDFLHDGSSQKRSMELSSN